jgi:nucleotide-binding universal stress UspA family protein
MFGKTIVGVDDSSSGRDAIALAQRLAAPDGKLTLVHVVCISAWEPFAPLVGNAFERTEHGERERAEELLRTARDQAGIACGRSAISTKVVWSPSVGRGLHELAESEGADLLVLGSSRR